MGQIVIPLPSVQNPLELGDNNDWAQNLPQEYQYLDLEGDYPAAGPGARSYGDSGEYTPNPNITPGPIPDNPGFERLNAILENCLAQDWSEKGNPGNPRILECYKVCGLNYNCDNCGRDYYWCAAFVSWALETAGIESPRTMGSQVYVNYGGEVDWRDLSNIRKNDIVVFKATDRQGGHVGFIQEITSNGTLKVLGGNQGDRVKISNYSFGGELYVTHFKRNWAIPPEFDVPIDGTAAAAAGNDSTT
jgi:uncharacterized protein (TIGR02594 family)